MSLIKPDMCFRVTLEDLAPQDQQDHKDREYKDQR